MKSSTASSTSTPIATSISSEKTEKLSLNELREVVLNMIQRKDEIELLNKDLKESLNIKESINKGLEEKLNIVEKELTSSREIFQNKIQSLENENKLLKDQLKKYVSAVQLIRPTTSEIDPNENKDSKQTSPTLVNRTTSIIPPINPNLQRDYSFEAEQYEQKLIQVCFHS
jgi:hypothetical protein